MEKNLLKVYGISESLSIVISFTFNEENDSVDHLYFVLSVVLENISSSSPQFLMVALTINNFNEN